MPKPPKPLNLSDKQVEEFKRGAAEAAGKRNGGPEPLPPEPTPTVEWDGDLALLLNDTAKTIQRFFITGIHEAVFLALWLAHTWAFEAAEVTPYGSVTSATKRCGKTNLLKLMAKIARNAEGPLVNPTDSIVFRVFDLHNGPPALILDELDQTFKDQKSRGDLISMINAGYQDGGTIPRTEGQSPNFTVRRFEVFAPKLFGSIGDLPDTILDRAVSIKLHRKSRGEKVERFRRRPVALACAPLRERFAAWRHAGCVAQLTDAEPTLPDSLDDRAQDMHEPLLAIADLAGHKWPQLARRAALALSANRDLDDDSIDVDLLRRCHAAFKNIERLHTVDLLTLVCTTDDDSRFRPWWWDEGRGDIPGKPNSKAARQLGVRLRKFDIHAEKNAFVVDGKQGRGYTREAFEAVWERYAITNLTVESPDYPSTRQPVPQTRMVEPETGLTGGFGLTGSQTRPVNPQTRMVEPKNSEVDGLTGQNGDRVRIPVIGDSDYPLFIANRRGEGHLTRAEWRQRRDLHETLVNPNIAVKTVGSPPLPYTRRK